MLEMPELSVRMRAVPADDRLAGTMTPWPVCPRQGTNAARSLKCGLHTARSDEEPSIHDGKNQDNLRTRAHT
jgi:hypothetical protein